MKRLIVLTACTGLLQTAAAEADDAALLQPGAYEVQVRLELPHVEEFGTNKVAKICVPSADTSGIHGLRVLSDNNPLAHCPAANPSQRGATLVFDIACPGGNAAIASANYMLSGTAFDGRITMKMGGKNMTMTEIQSGHRIGACQGSETP